MGFAEAVVVAAGDDAAVLGDDRADHGVRLNAAAAAGGEAQGAPHAGVVEGGEGGFHEMHCSGGSGTAERVYPKEHASQATPSTSP